MFDTRSKILPMAEALTAFQGRPVVAGYFDPLFSTHTDRLQELAAAHGPLAVCVCELPDALLPARARAELAAACRFVEWVTVGDAAAFGNVLDERAGDLERRAALARHVQTRQKAAGNG